MLEIKTKLARGENYKKSVSPRNIQFIVIHYTGNNKDTAKSNANYFANTVTKTSAHYFVDEKEIWRSVEDKDIAYAVGTTGKYYSACRNSTSISIEMCNSLTVVPAAVRARTIELTIELMNKYNIPLSNVIRHYDVTHKKCPAPYVNNTTMWALFKKELEDNLMTEKEVKKIVAEVLAEKRTLGPTIWLQKEWAQACADKITDGSAPQGYITREECAAMVERAMEKAKNGN